MKSKYRLNAPVGAAMVLSAIVLFPMLVRAGGSLTPPGAPAVTMKSLQEIEPRTIISGPTTITLPGSYYLSNNIVVSSGNGITIAASGVTLDLNGFTITSTAASATGYGIYVGGSYDNIRIFNGFILGGVVDNGSGTFSGSGFAYGIYAGSASNVQVSDVDVFGVLYYGIYLGSTSLVESCNVSSVGVYGIYAVGNVQGCTAFYCGGTSYGAAIWGVTVSDSVAGSNWAADGIDAYNVNNSYGFSSSGNGLYVYNCANNSYGSTSTGNYGLVADVANNCYGSSYDTNGYGLYAGNATECYGYGGYAGIYGYHTAIGCYGSSDYGYGVFATVAENCYGYCGAGTGGTTSWGGIYAESANNCYGSSYYCPGIRASAINNSAGESTYSYGIYGYGSSLTSSRSGSTVQNSYGYSYYSYGMSVPNAINCYGRTTSGYYGLYADNAENCYGYNESTGEGLGAGVASGCYGYAPSGYEGLTATVANNCYGVVYGSQTYAYGLSATLANNCYGYSGSTGNYGRGIVADNAINCYGEAYSTYGYGLDAYNTAIGCTGYGDGSYSYGIVAYIANSSYGSGYYGNSISYKYNMP